MRTRLSTYSESFRLSLLPSFAGAARNWHRRRSGAGSNAHGLPEGRTGSRPQIVSRLAFQGGAPCGLPPLRPARTPLASRVLAQGCVRIITPNRSLARDVSSVTSPHPSGPQVLSATHCRGSGGASGDILFLSDPDLLDNRPSGPRDQKIAAAVAATVMATHRPHWRRVHDAAPRNAQAFEKIMPGFPSI